VTTRQFLPIAGFLFVAFVAGMWAYVSKPTVDLAFGPKAQIANPSGGAPGRTDPADSAYRWSALSSRHRLMLRQRLHKSLLVWRGRFGRWAEFLDTASVRFRLRLAAHPVVQLAAGWYALQRGRPQEGLDRFDRLLRHHSDDVSALAGKAACLLALKRYQDAADIYKRLISIAPWNDRARYNDGVLLSRLGHFGAAAVQFRAVLDRDPTHADALYNLAALAQRDGRLREARDAWVAYAQLRPNDAAAWFNLGVVYLDFEQPFQAVRCLSIAVAIDPDNSDGHVNLAVAEARSGHPEAALEALNVADELSPCDPTIVQMLADLRGSLAAWSPLEVPDDPTP